MFTLTDCARTLEEAARVTIAASPRIMIVDKAMGGPTVLEWLTRMTQLCAEYLFRDLGRFDHGIRGT